MALQFNPYPQVEPDNRGRQNMQLVLDSMSRVGNGLAGYQQQQYAQHRQGALDQYMREEEARKQRQFDSDYGTPIDPNTMASDASTQTGYSSFMPGGSAPVSNASPLIEQFNKWRAGGMQRTAAQPEFMGALGKDERKIFQDQNSPQYQSETELKKAQADKARRDAMGGGDRPDYAPEDLTDAQNGNFKAIAARHGGLIPHSFASLAESASARADTAYEKKRTDAQNGMINVRGDQSIARTEAQRDAAALAYNTIQRVKSENRQPTPLEYYDLLGQMWKARTGAAPTDQAIRDLDQKTFQGNLGKVYTYFTGQTAGATTSDILDNLQNFIAESGTQAEKQHEAYMSPRQSRVLNGLRPEDQKSLLNTNRGMSFQEQTGYKPKAIYANNGKDRIMSTDGGQTWQPAQ